MFLISSNSVLSIPVPGSVGRPHGSEKCGLALKSIAGRYCEFCTGLQPTLLDETGRMRGCRSRIRLAGELITLRKGWTSGTLGHPIGGVPVRPTILSGTMSRNVPVCPNVPGRITRVAKRIQSGSRQRSCKRMQTGETARPRESTTRVAPTESTWRRGAPA